MNYKKNAKEQQLMPIRILSACIVLGLKMRRKGRILLAALVAAMVFSPVAYSTINVGLTDLDIGTVFKPDASQVPSAGAMGDGIRLAKPIDMNQQDFDLFASNTESILNEMMARSPSFRAEMIALSNENVSSLPGGDGMTIGYMPDPNVWIKERQINGITGKRGDNQGLVWELAGNGRRSNVNVDSAPGEGASVMIGFDDALLRGHANLKLGLGQGGGSVEDPALVQLTLERIYSLVGHESSHASALVRGLGVPTGQAATGSNGILFEEIENIGFVPRYNRQISENLIRNEMGIANATEYAGRTFDLMKFFVRGASVAPDTSGRAAWTQWSESIKRYFNIDTISGYRTGCMQ